MEESLKKKVVKGTFWVFVSQIATQFIALVKNIIIARILSPDDFGLFGIALIALSLFDVFSQTGFDAALIQKKENIEEYLDTAFVVNIFRGVILFVLLFFAAPYVGIFFENTLVTPIVRIISFTFLINGLINPGTIYFIRELDFKKQFYWDMSRTITDIVVSLSIIFLLRNVWVLVIASISSYLTRAVVSYLIHSFRPKFRFKKEYASSLFKFGKWVLASSILVYLVTQGDDAFVGKVLGVTWLGFYRMAYRFSNLPATHITHVISRVSFPAYSKLQEDIPRLREAYLKILQVISFFTFPIAGLIFVLAPDFTKIFLGEKWMPMVPAMQMLVFAGLIRSIAATAGPIFNAVGKPRINTMWQIVRLSVLAVLIYPFTTKWGILGTSIAVFFSIFVSNVGFSYEAIKITKCAIKSFSKAIIFPLINGIIMVSAILALKVVINATEFKGFFSLVCVGVLIYISIALLFDRNLIFKMQSLLKESLRYHGRE